MLQRVGRDIVLKYDTEVGAGGVYRPGIAEQRLGDVGVLIGLAPIAVGLVHVGEGAHLVASAPRQFESQDAVPASLKDAVQSIRALKMLGSNISMPNKTVVHKYLDEVDEAAKLCGAINTVVNMRDENGQVTGKLKGYNTDGMGYWQGLKEEGIDFKGMKMVLIGTGGAATAIAVRGALDGIAEIEIFNIKDKFYSRGEEIVDLINKNTNCKATMNDLADHDLLKEKMHAADLFCDATGVGMHPLEDLSNIPDPSFFKKDLIVTDTVYAPRETVMMKQAKEAGCERVYNGMSMMLFQALIAIKLYTGKDTPVDYMKEKLGI